MQQPWKMLQPERVAEVAVVRGFGWAITGLGQLARQLINEGNSTDDTEFYFRSFLRLHRQGLRRRRFTGRFRQRARRAHDRHARYLSRIEKNRLYGAYRVPLPKYTLISRYTESPLLEALRPGRRSRWVPMVHRAKAAQTARIELNNFSFIHNPAGTLKALKELGEAEETCTHAHIDFLDRHCTDVGAYLVLAEIWPTMGNIFQGGKMMPAIQKVIEAVNLRKPLQMKRFNVDSTQGVWAFDVKRRRPTGSSKSAIRHLAPQAKEKVADDFCSVLNEWLGVFNVELSDAGQSRFTRIITELLDNAERHSDPDTKDGTWTIAAFMARRLEQGQPVYRCYISFLSIGKTIAETLQRADQDILEDIQRYVKLHGSAPGQSPETLATLFAIQDGVTCDPEARRDKRGGVGIQDVIDFVSTLGGNGVAGREPAITVVSGRACLQLRPPYLDANHTGGIEERLIWCNPSNSSAEPPDPSFVYELEDRFAGTVVSVELVLDPDFLESRADGRD